MTGRIVVRQRDDGAQELRVNGVFVMDDRETTSERLLATSVLELGARHILVGGLGLGFTLRELLDRDTAAGGAASVVVAELERELVDLMANGEIPGAGLITDRRVRVEIGDVRDTVRNEPPSSLDAIVLDVDNGPDFLVHASNAEIYGTSFVSACADRLTPDGHLVVWSMADSASLRETLAEHFGDVTATEVPVQLQGRRERYWLLRGSRPTRV